MAMLLRCEPSVGRSFLRPGGKKLGLSTTGLPPRSFTSRRTPVANNNAIHSFLLRKKHPKNILSEPVAPCKAGSQLDHLLSKKEMEERQPSLYPKMESRKHREGIVTDDKNMHASIMVPVHIPRKHAPSRPGERNTYST